MTGLFKAVRPDGTTRNGLDWNVPTGSVIRADHNVSSPDHGGVCPKHEGDGISVAKTWRGAAQAGHPTVRCCTVTVDPADIIAEDANKMRVRRVTVGVWFDATALLRAGFGQGADLTGAGLTDADLIGADLIGADLIGADLTRANLTDADLTGANLRRANLRRANLRRANLARADLFGADLAGADLAGANLYGADLTNADLTGADLYGANLTNANLTYTNLRRANLAGAYLTGADLGGWERGPDGYARRKATT